MRAQLSTAASILLVLGLLALSGCSSEEATASTGFEPGAFPPTLSGEEYHEKSWTRTDCLTCHEQGVNDAPKMKHVSIPEIAAGAKCRTCHVFIADQKAPKK